MVPPPPPPDEGGVGVVGVDAANFCRGQDHDVGPLRLNEVPDGELVSQIQFRVDSGDNICLSGGPELPNYCAAHHAAVPCDVILSQSRRPSSQARLEVPARAL